MCLSAAHQSRLRRFRIGKLLYNIFEEHVIGFDVGNNLLSYQPKVQNIARKSLALVDDIVSYILNIIYLAYVVWLGIQMDCDGDAL